MCSALIAFFIRIHKCIYNCIDDFSPGKKIRRKDNWRRIVFGFKALRNSSGQEYKLSRLVLCANCKGALTTGSSPTPLENRAGSGKGRYPKAGQITGTVWPTALLTKIEFSSYLSKWPLAPIPCFNTSPNIKNNFSYKVFFIILIN